MDDIKPMETTRRPSPPIVPFPAWTWTTPVIPQFYWNVYSAEQRIKQICLSIGKIEDYLNYAVTLANDAHAEIEQRIDNLQLDIDEQIKRVEAELAAEVNRLDADIAALRRDLTTTQDNLAAEINDRKSADNTLHDEISAETTARIHADDVLHDEISAETTARVEGDETLTTALATESATRERDDNALSGRIDTVAGDLATETSERKSEDAKLAQRIADVDGDLAEETTNREAADEALQADINTRLKPGDIVAANRITVTTGPGNRVTIGDTFDASFDSIETAIAELQAALTAETDERRHDDATLTEAVNNRLKLGAVLGEAPITVTNDPDSTTATVGIDAASDTAPGVVTLTTVRGQSRSGPGLTDSVDQGGATRTISVKAQKDAGIVATTAGVAVALNPNGGLYHTAQGVAMNQKAVSNAMAPLLAGDGLKVVDNKLALALQAGRGIKMSGGYVAVNAGNGLDFDSEGKLIATGGGGGGSTVNWEILNNFSADKFIENQAPTGSGRLYFGANNVASNMKQTYIPAGYDTTSANNAYIMPMHLWFYMKPDAIPDAPEAGSTDTFVQPFISNSNSGTGLDLEFHIDTDGAFSGGKILGAHFAPAYKLYPSYNIVIDGVFDVLLEFDGTKSNFVITAWLDTRELSSVFSVIKFTK